MSVLTGARVVTPQGVLDDGWVEVSDGRVARVGRGPAPGGARDLGGGWLLPGFVDLHMHGGGGHDVTQSANDMRAAVEFHRGHGTTSTLVSLMTAPVDALCEQLGWACELTAAGSIAGVHLEGPFLSAARCGAQNAGHLLLPDPLVLAKLLDAGQGSIRTITVAPELPGGLALIAEIRRAGVVAAVGHTDATYEQAAAAFATGAGLTTHLFNAMASMRQRAPGPALAALDAGVAVELINDGVHVHAALGRHVAQVAPDRLVLITDSTSAAGLGDGRYTLGDQDVAVSDGQVRLAGSDRLAGSTLTMDEAVRRAVVDLGLSMPDAARAAATTPARVLGIDGRTGAIAAGLDADLVHLDPDLRVAGVYVRGAARPGAFPLEVVGNRLENQPVGVRSEIGAPVPSSYGVDAGPQG